MNFFQRHNFLCENIVLNEVSLKSVTTILKWPVANVQWVPPGSDYSKSMAHDHSKVADDHFLIV